ncbi:MAG: tetratricopeptide repeat protein [Pseudomonadota bacterium]|nr:tetratricopeptide repeat protein [Pseudomonadota bacterium]
MAKVLHQTPTSLSQSAIRRIFLCWLASVVAFGAGGQFARAGGQGGYPGGAGGVGGRGGMSQAGTDPGGEVSSTVSAEKPDAAAKKAFTAGVKSLNRAKEYEEVAAKATDADKKGVAMEKVGDAYERALDQFTETLRNRADMFEAWNYVGYIHLRLGAYPEAIDDYNHTLALRPALPEAVEHRAEAYLAMDHLDETKMAYMDLFNHDRPPADQLMAAMQKWFADHRTAANGMRPADIDAFGKWLQERDGIAKATASAAAP